ncbi:MAG: hypothetical protein PHU13_03965 [Acholeplasmataceae bacterium]|nr:hypothetical protein [Acholeplasmataceae bacterium]
MSNKILNFLFFIFLFVVILAAILGMVYEYLIWDKSIIPDIIFNLLLIIGYISLAALLVVIILDKIV